MGIFNLRVNKLRGDLRGDVRPVKFQFVTGSKELCAVSAETSCILLCISPKFWITEWSGDRNLGVVGVSMIFKAMRLYMVTKGVRASKGEEERAKDVAMGHSDINGLGTSGQTSQRNRKGAAGGVGGKPGVWSHGNQVKEVYNPRGRAQPLEMLLRAQGI